MNYEERKETRIERLKERAKKAQSRSNAYYEHSHKLVEHIPFGQPILVGHHSEGRHRRTLERSNNYMGKSVNESSKAQYYAKRAKAAENNTAIFSDDPEAITKLKEKLAGLENCQKMMKDANRIIRKHKNVSPEAIKELVEIGFNEKQANKLFEPGTCGSIGFPSYSLQNNNATIRGCKLRIAELEKRSNEETTEKEINGVKVVDNVEENRLQLFFDGKPEYEIRQKLKRSGFRWSRYNGCWQRHRSNSAKWIAEDLLKSLSEQVTG